MEGKNGIAGNNLSSSIEGGGKSREATKMASSSAAVTTDGSVGGDCCEATTSALEAPNDKSLRIPCYCEENVWRLACRKLDENNKQQQQQQQDEQSYHVVFVSNKRKCVPMFHQVAAKNDPSNTPCCWDYHVILFCTTSSGNRSSNGISESAGASSSSETMVLDIDSVLPYPCPLEDYLTETFPSDFNYTSVYAPMFRVIDAELYLKNFSSDRLHMYDPITKAWNAPPPPYPCILPHPESNLATYINMEEEDGLQNGKLNEKSLNTPGNDNDLYGKVYTLETLQSRFFLS